MRNVSLLLLFSLAKWNLAIMIAQDWKAQVSGKVGKQWKLQDPN